MGRRAEQASGATYQPPCRTRLLPRELAPLPFYHRPVVHAGVAGLLAFRYGVFCFADPSVVVLRIVNNAHFQFNLRRALLRARDRVGTRAVHIVSYRANQVNQSILSINQIAISVWASWSAWQWHHRLPSHILHFNTKTTDGPGVRWDVECTVIDWLIDWLQCYGRLCIHLRHLLLHGAQWNVWTLADIAVLWILGADGVFWLIVDWLINNLKAYAIGLSLAAIAYLASRRFVYYIYSRIKTD